jgi:cyclopropane-fatty-acyl-phospholipid synthase
MLFNKKAALSKLFSLWSVGAFEVQYWDGTKEKIGTGTPGFLLRWNKEPGIRDIKSTDIILTISEAYMKGLLDIEGNLDNVIRTMFVNDKEENVSKTYDFRKLRKKLDAGMEAQEAKNIHAHYDLGNDFFALWLDKSMSYSCGYFEHPNDTLEEAQEQKIEHSLRKLCLKPGEKLLDIGCGWGALVIKAAREYDVHAVGITLSKEQCAGANKKIKELGLEKQCEVRYINYLDLDGNKEKFDKIVSIGMFEHVGKEFFPLYFDKINSLLKEDGLFLLHSIMGTVTAPTNSFMHKYIFPGGYVPSVEETVAYFPDFRLNILYMESLRLHYAATLDRWHANYMKHFDEVAKMYDRKFARMWSLYLRGCAAAFRTGYLDIFQILLAKTTSNDIPINAKYIFDEPK